MKPEDAPELFTPDSPGDATPPALGNCDQPAHSPHHRAGRAELLSTLERLERTLDEMRGGMEASVRENRHREFSPARMVGSIAQVLVVGLVLWGLSDWIFRELEQIYIKIGFAVVMQLAALTAFLIARESDRG